MRFQSENAVFKFFPVSCERSLSFSKKQKQKKKTKKESTKNWVAVLATFVVHNVPRVRILTKITFGSITYRFLILRFGFFQSLCSILKLN